MDIKRREFIGSALAGSAMGLPFASGAQNKSAAGGAKEYLYRSNDEVVIEKAASGKPHAGKVLAAIEPHHVSEKYYFARGPQLVNRIVDISAHVDQKVDANVAIVTQGPGGNNGARLRQRLAAKGQRLPILANDDDTANRQYVKHFVLDYDSKARRGVPSDRELGRKYGLEWAEAFHYIGPPESRLDPYIEEHQKAL